MFERSKDTYNGLSHVALDKEQLDVYIEDDKKEEY